MSEFFDRISKLSPQRLALLAMDLQSKLETAEASRHEPIAVVGMGCRLPGANNPDEYWQLLHDGVDVIRDVPADRWDSAALFDPDPDAPGKIATRWGGFIDGIDRFDPQVFGITPREAMSLDPQQRLLLEVAWEALENAGQAPDKLSGSSTGVFVGICNGDYGHRLLAGDDSDIDVYVSTGNAYSVASGRLSYVLGLQGPSISVDTACSSSLVSIHLAIQSLRNRECRMALAGGVNIVLSPNTTAALSRAKMMASDGRCKAFDAAADGFVRSEGCGLVVLKRLSDAIANGDRILALIRGSAVNQDGRSNGLTAPNGPSQIAVIRAALADAQLQPADVGYVETHGTGTSLGDPIEAQALGAALGQGRTTPLIIGSVKTNMGHLESAAGVTGLIKTVLMLQHGEIPPHLHFTRPSPYIPWDRLPLKVPTQLTPWTGDRRIAGVSSFGFSGTNAHILLENAPLGNAPAAQVALPSTDRPLQLLALSARSEIALRELANRYAHFLGTNPEIALADVTYTAGTGRAQFNHRLAMRGTDSTQVGQALAAWASGEAIELIQAGTTPGPREPEVTFLFTGHGAHYAGMGRSLYATQPIFRAAIDCCAEVLLPLMDRPLREVLGYEGQHNTLLDQLVYSQPALFALQYGLSQLWNSWGVQPAAVAGHSAGEYAAAVAAGVMSLEDGLKLIATRGKLMQALPPNGEMAAVLAGEARVRQLIAPYADRVSIAAVNGPNSVVLSGVREAVQAAVASLRAAGLDVRSLNIPIAAHSSMVEPMLAPLERAAASVSLAQPQIDIVSTVTGDLLGPNEMRDAAYWRRHSRLPVRFGDAVQRLYDQGRRVFVEIGPHSTLLGMLCHVVPEREVICAPSLRRDQDEWQVMLRSLGALFVSGVSVDWAAIHRGTSRQRLALPTYPFQRERYWIDPKPARVIAPAQTSTNTPLLGKQLRSPALSGMVFETDISLERLAFLDHHRIHGTLLMPSPAYLEMARAAANEVFGPGLHAIEAFAISEPLILPEQGAKQLQTVVGTAQDGRAPVQIFSREAGTDQWTLHVTAQIVAANPVSTDRTGTALTDITAIQTRCAEQIDGEAYYQLLRELGLEFGEDFRGIRQIWRRDGEAIASVVLPERLMIERSAYGIHPALLDACFHALGAPLPQRDEPASYLLIGIDHFQLHRPPTQQLWNHVVLCAGHEPGGQVFTGDITLYDDAGQQVAEARGVHLKLASPEAFRRAVGQHTSDWFYEVTWQPQQRNESETRVDLASVADALRNTAKTLASQHNLADYQTAIPALDDLALAYAARGMRELGWAPRAGHTAASLGIAPRHRRLGQHLLERLNTAINSAEVMQPVTADELDRRAEELAARYPAIRAEVELTRRCGAQLADVLRGTSDPLQLLFPNGSLAATESIYGDTPSAKANNALVAEAVRELATRTGKRPLRVLEIGAGSGATTAAVRAALPAGQSEYWFTDLSPLFLARARERFGNDPSMHYALLDIAHDPLAQGFEASQFDVVIAANVMHATADLRQTLTHAQQLLAAGGALVLLEGAAPQLWVDITFGLTEGWWMFADHDLRPNYPLLGAAQWSPVLQALGFAQVETLSASGTGLGEPNQVIVTAHKQVTSWIADDHDWLIFGDANGLGQALVAHVQASGAAVKLITRNTAALQPHELAQVLGNLRSDTPLQVVYLWGLDAAPGHDASAEDGGAAQEPACVDVLTLTRALASSGRRASLWVVTRGGHAIGNEMPSPSQAPLWGLGRVIELEHPELWGGLIDLDRDGIVADEARDLALEIKRPDGEDQIALRNDTRFVARLARRSAPVPQTSIWKPDGAYLITGGLGGLGLKVAHWMAEQGARHIVLVGRHALPDRAEWPSLEVGSRAASQAAAIESIEALGATVHTFAVDVGNCTQVASLINRFGTTLPPLRGLIHAAADLSTWTVAEMPPEALHAMMQAKATSAWWLHELTQQLPLDFFVMFSSTTGVWGSRAMAHYAAANHTLDVLAHYRRTKGLPALSIDWGTWDEMRIASADERERVANFGLHPMPSDDALCMLGNLLGHDDITQIVVAHVDWERLRAVYEARRRLPMLSNMSAPGRGRAAPAQTARTHIEQPMQAELVRRLENTQPAERAAAVLEHVRVAVAHTLNLDINRPIDMRQGLFEMGMDSLMSVELKGRLEASVGQALPSTLTFNYPSIEALAGYLADTVLELTPKRAETLLTVALSESAADVGSAVSEIDDDISEDELAELLAAKLARLH